MSTSYPTSVDTYTRPSTTDQLNSPSHAGAHDNAYDAIEALEAKVGTTSSAVTTSHDYKLSGVTGSDKAASLTGSEVLTNKTLTAPTVQGAVDGWISANENWVYASASTITVPSGAASRYAKGDRIKWTQTTVKYGVIVAVADTLLTIAVNTDYTVADAAISNNCYSHEVSPVGYPGWFAYTPTFTGWSSDPTGMSNFYIIGTQCTVVIQCIGGTSNSATTNFTLPVASANIAQSQNTIVGVCDAGTDQSYPGIVGVSIAGTGSATAKVGKTFAARSGNVYGGFTASGAKGFEGTITYQF